MDLTFKINGNAPNPHLGIIEGYIQEGLNQVSFIELILISNTAFDDAACTAYIGKTATIGLGDLIDGSLLWSRFDGVIYEFHVLDSFGLDDGMFKYQMIIRPPLWDLNFMVRAQSYPDKNRIEVIEDIFQFSALQPDQHYKIVIPGKDDPDQYPKCKQILQNKISDLVFVQNLLNEAGINYFYCAEKDGNTREYLKLIDNQVQFLNPFKKSIPYNPGSGLGGSNYRIDWLEIHHRASMGKTRATANLGDGKVKVFEDEENVKSYYGMYWSYGCEGEKEQVAKQSATTRAQYFTTSQTIYEGRSNHFIIRPGEKISIGDGSDPTGTKVLHEVLMTTVFHHFRQTPSSAQSGDNHPEYGNLFTSVKRLADYRPDQTFGKTVIEMKRIFSQAHSLPGVDTDDDDAISRADLAEVEKYQLKRQIADLTRELAVTKELSGLMVGEVIEDASVTPGNELICKVKNEKFPEGLTIKVALGWLTQQGWFYVLPRVGVQVYFQFINGEGGQNEAVLVGYRPTETRPVLDPKKTTDCKQLGSGGPPNTDDAYSKVVGSSKFSPLNKFRNALMGENGVSEVAVIDGGEDSVYINADKRICLISKKSVSVSTGSICEAAGSMSQQFGSMSRGVKNDEIINVHGAHETRIGGLRFLKVGETSIENTTGKVWVTSNEEIEHSSGSAHIVIKKDASIEASLPGKTITIDTGKISGVVGTDTGWQVEGKGVTIRSADSIITIEKAGTVNIHGPTKVTVVSDTEVYVEAPNVKINGKTETLITGGGAKVTVGQGIVKMNC